MNLCACGCGTETRGTWARGHSKRGYPSGTPKLLGEDPSDFEDIGFATPSDTTSPAPAPSPSATPSAPPPPSPAPSPSPPPPETGWPPEDAGPAHARKNWAKNVPRVKAVKVTAAVRADVLAKISLPLEVSGRIWEIRDPVCGGTFIKQKQDIALALTEIVCDSADLVAFFTGPGGGFMKYLQLGAALWPVAEVVGAHHVFHSIEEPGEPPLEFRA